ncbi:MAG: hypothetical protein C5B54_08165 [Acidobacteria bacterium]|nr:MAG: hypothetical protein C5B54_08165 [Acidobacteriota bacterium]
MFAKERTESRRRSLKRKIILCSFVLILGCIFAASAFAADASDLASRAAAWEKAYNADDLKGVAALYAADGCRMPPNIATVHGTEAIIGQLKSGKDQGGAKVKVAVTSAETNGDMGYGTGTFEITKADGSHLDHGKWMNVSKKVGGSWKIVCDIWNSDMPMPAPPAAK